MIEDLTMQRPIKEERYVLDLILDDSEEVVGVSIKTTEEKKDELIWIETLSDGGLGVTVNPDLKDIEEDQQDFWVLLYCISANLKNKEETIWGDLTISEIAEDIYASRKECHSSGEELTELLKTYEGLELIPENELPEEIEMVIDLETLTDVVASYEDDEALIVVDFINIIAELSGEDFQIGVTEVNTETGEEKPPKFHIGDGEEEVIKPKPEPEPKTQIRETEMLEPNYVIKHLSSLINYFIGLEETGLDAIAFLNQLVYERAHIQGTTENEEE